MTALTRLFLSAAFLVVVALMDPNNGLVAFRTASEVLADLLSIQGLAGEHSVQLAQLTGGVAAQRPSHELLEFAAQAFGYPVSSSLHLGLTLTGMLLVGAGVMLRCRQD